MLYKMGEPDEVLRIGLRTHSYTQRHKGIFVTLVGLYNDHFQIVIKFKGLHLVVFDKGLRDHKVINL